jgi:hypothetical protein
MNAPSRPLALGLFLAACGSEAPLRDTPDLVLRDSVLVIDTGAAPMSPPNAVVVTADGTTYLADGRNGVLVAVDQTGSILRRIGRRGMGPGEWARGPGHPMLLDGDSALVVNDGGGARRVSLAAGAITTERLPPARMAVLHSVSGGRLLYHAPDGESRSTLAIAASWTDSVRRVGPFPAHLVGRPDLQMYFGQNIASSPWDGDSVLVAIEGVDSVYVWSLLTDTGRTVSLPAIQRRGAKLDLVMGFNATDPASFERSVYQPSQPRDIARLGRRDTVVVMHSDVALVQGRITAQHYLSLVDLASGRSCPDAALPIPADPMAAVWLAGRSITVATQEDDAAGTVHTIIRTFTISGAGCRWR